MFAGTSSIAPALPAGPLELKYLFGALLSDGTEYFQTQEDKSPFTKGRNALYELLEHDDDGEPVEHPIDRRLVKRGDISMFQMSDDVHRYIVDLTDGHFEIQYTRGRKLVGVPFFLSVPPPGEKLRLLYFLRRRQNATLTGVVQGDGSVQASKLEPVSQECEYHFGWETEDKQHKAEMILV